MVVPSSLPLDPHCLSLPRATSQERIVLEQEEEEEIAAAEDDLISSDRKLSRACPMRCYGLNPQSPGEEPPLARPSGDSS